MSTLLRQFKLVLIHRRIRKNTNSKQKQETTKTHTEKNIINLILTWCGLGRLWWRYEVRVYNSELGHEPWSGTNEKTGNCLCFAHDELKSVLHRLRDSATSAAQSATFYTFKQQMMEQNRQRIFKILNQSLPPLLTHTLIYNAPPRLIKLLFKSRIPLWILARRGVKGCQVWVHAHTGTDAESSWLRRSAAICSSSGRRVCPF